MSRNDKPYVPVYGGTPLPLPSPDDTQPIPAVSMAKPPRDPKKSGNKSSRRNRKGKKGKPVQLPTDNWRWQVFPRRGHIPHKVLKLTQQDLNESTTGRREDQIVFFERYHVFKAVATCKESIGVLGASLLLVVAGLILLIIDPSITPPGGQPMNISRLVGIAALLGLIGCLIGGGYFYVQFYAWRYQFIELTNQRFILRNKYPPKNSIFLGNDSDDTSLVRIESVDVQQSRPGGWFNYGNLIVNVVGDSTPKELIMVADPWKIKQIIIAEMTGAQDEGGVASYE